MTEIPSLGVWSIPTIWRNPGMPHDPHVVCNSHAWRTTHFASSSVWHISTKAFAIIDRPISDDGENANVSQSSAAHAAAALFESGIPRSWNGRVRLAFARHAQAFTELNSPRIWSIHPDPPQSGQGVMMTYSSP
jgi:hypothetical protein